MMITSVERARRSDENLVNKGGKILCVRLGKQHFKKLTSIMKATGLNRMDTLRYLLDQYDI